MAIWKHTVTLKHLYDDVDLGDPEDVRGSMAALADALDSNPIFRRFDTSLFRQMPDGDSFFSTEDYANKLLERLYDFADEKRIWIE